MLRWRLAGAALIILPTLVLLWMDDQHNFGRPGIWLMPVGLLIGWVGARELATLLSTDPTTRAETPWYAALAIAIQGMPVCQFWDVADCKLGFWGWTPLAVLTVTGLALIVEMRRFGQGDHVAPRVTTTLMSVSFLAIPFAFVLALRLIEPFRIGLLLMVSVIFVAKWADAGAYFTGRAIGRTPLAPILSPKKTWEGFIGGAVFAFAAAWGLHWLLPQLLDSAPAQPPWFWLLMYALTLTAAGLLGDLSISLFKRDAERKDSSDLLPGLGGCLDVIDSMLFACPVGYLWWISQGWIS